MPKIIKPVRRRTFIQASLALGASQVIGAPFILTARGDEPVKIGMVNPLTGVLAALAQSEVDGAKAASTPVSGLTIPIFTGSSLRAVRMNGAPIT